MKFGRWIAKKSQSPEIDLDETEDDDLDIEPQCVKQRTEITQHTTTSTIPRPRDNERTSSYGSSLFASSPKEHDAQVDSKRLASLLGAKDATSPVPNVDDFGHLSKRSVLPPKLMEKMKRRKEAETKKQETKEETVKKSTSRISDVPTFLL